MAKQETNERTLRRMLRPRSAICECDGKVELFVEMPGVAKNSLEIRVEDAELKIIGRRSSSDDSRGRYLVKERIPGDYSHSFVLDETIDRDRIDATLEDGVLVVSLGIHEAAKPRRIEVKTK